MNNELGNESGEANGQKTDSVDKQDGNFSSDSDKQNHLNMLLLNSLPHAAMLINKDRIILAANKLATEVGAMIGGACWQDFGHCQSLSGEHKALIESKKCLQSYETHCTFCLADQALSKNIPLNDPEVHAFDRIWDTYWVPLDEEVYLHYAIDVTERITKDEAIKESADRLHTLIDTTNAGYFFIDTDGIFRDVNNAWLAMHGYETKDEIIGKPFTLTQVDAKQADAAAIVKSLLNDSHVPTGEFNRRNKDGSTGYHSFTAKPVKKNDEVIGLEGFLIDTTEQRQSKRDYEVLFNEMLDGFALHEIICDKDNKPIDYRFIAINPAFEKLTTLKASDIVGKTVLEVLPDTEKRWIDTYGRVVQTGEPVLINNYAQSLDKHFEVTAYKSSETQFVTIFQDVTKQKKAEQNEKDLREQLSRTERLKSLAVLAGGVAHDLNNILGPMVMLPEIINNDLVEAVQGDTESKEQIVESLDVIQSSANRAAVVVRDLVALSRGGYYDRVPTNINELSSIINPVDPDNHKRKTDLKIKVKYNISKDKLYVLASSIHLCRVIDNLTRNAIEGVKKKGTVTVSTYKKTLNEPLVGYTTIPKGDYAVIEVSDDGIGIAPDYLGKIFDPFFTKKKKSERSGSGLGLSVVHGVTMEHNGFIDVTSKVDKGTTFSIYLPLINGSAKDTKESKKETIVGGSEHILIVDDEPSQRFLVKRSMGKLGYTVVDAEDGHEALELFEQAKKDAQASPFDLVVLDMIMEDGFDGLDTLNEILKLYPEQKVVIASGHAENDRSQAAQNLGADWLAKPYDMENIARVARKLLDKKS